MSSTRSVICASRKVMRIIKVLKRELHGGDTLQRYRLRVFVCLCDETSEGVRKTIEGGYTGVGAGCL